MEIKREYLEWASGHDTGISSKTIMSILTGMPVNYKDVPHDIGDVGRCVRMLRLFPELRSRLGEMAYIDKWRPYIDAWKELERRYDECVAFEKLSLDEIKKLKRKKHFYNPSQSAWDILQNIGYASKYLDGWRGQNSTSSFRKTPPETY